MGKFHTYSFGNIMLADAWRNVAINLKPAEMHVKT
jgi:hypothetical protein